MSIYFWPYSLYPNLQADDSQTYFNTSHILIVLNKNILRLNTRNYDEFESVQCMPQMICFGSLQLQFLLLLHDILFPDDTPHRHVK